MTEWSFPRARRRAAKGGPLCPTPGPARPLGAAERRKQPPAWGRGTSRKTASLATSHKSCVNAAQTPDKLPSPGVQGITELHFRDLRRRVDRLEDRYLPPRPIRVIFEFLDPAAALVWRLAIGRSQRPIGGWGGAEIGRANGRSPLRSAMARQVIRNDDGHMTDPLRSLFRFAHHEVICRLDRSLPAAAPIDPVGPAAKRAFQIGNAPTSTYATSISHNRPNPIKSMA